MGSIKGLSLLKKRILFLLACIVLICAYVMATGNAESVANTAITTSGFVEKTRMIRWVGIILLVSFWPQVVKILGHYYNLPDDRRVYAESLRWRVAVYFIAFEFLVIEGVPGKLLGS